MTVAGDDVRIVSGKQICCSWCHCSFSHCSHIGVVSHGGALWRTLTLVLTGRLAELAVTTSRWSVWINQKNSLLNTFQVDYKSFRWIHSATFVSKNQKGNGTCLLGRSCVKYQIYNVALGVWLQFDDRVILVQVELLIICTALTSSLVFNADNQFGQPAA